MDLGEPSDRDIADTRSLQRDLKDLLTEPERGMSDDVERMEDIRRVCLLARLTLQDQACHRYLRELERYAECFLLVEDNPCWEWHTAKRYEKLRSMLSRLLRAFEIRLDCLVMRKRSVEIIAQIGSTQKWLLPARTPALQQHAAARRSRAPVPQ